MRPRHPNGRPSKVAQDAYRRLMRGDEISRLEKGRIDLEELPAIDMDTPPQLELALPELALDSESGGEHRQ